MRGVHVSRFERSAVPWFLQTFTKEEQKTWAVADVHWYVAWSNGDCDGRSAIGKRLVNDPSDTLVPLDARFDARLPLSWPQLFYVQ